MYNRYIPEGTEYTRVAAEKTGPPPSGKQPLLGLAHMGGESLEGLIGGLKGLARRLLPEGADLGDLLLVLIILLILVEEGDHLDTVITLGLMLLFSLGGSSNEG